MYAISFDLKIDVLKKVYGEQYNNAYSEIHQELKALGFDCWKQGCIYITKEESGSLATVYKAINKLASIKWFRESVRNIHAFKIEDLSDFTDIVKG